MAIKGLTDRETLKPRLPRLGKLRKGGEQQPHKTKKDKNGKPIMVYGDDLDHFRFTSDNPDIVATFEAAYGKQPRVINVVLFHDKTEDNFPSFIEAWDASGMVFRSDGENWLVWREGSVYRRGEKPHTDHDDQFEVGRLEVIIPELLQADFVGTVTLETHSNHDLRNITSVLMAAEDERGGSLRGAQFTLRRVEEEISVPGWGDRADKRSKAKKWLVKLEAPTRMFGRLIGAPASTPLIEPTTGEVIDEAGWDSLNDFLYQLHIDFGLSESEAKKTLKTLGFGGWPKNGGARAKSVEMYNAVAAHIATTQPTADDDLPLFAAGGQTAYSVE